MIAPSTLEFDPLTCETETDQCLLNAVRSGLQKSGYRSLSNLDCFVQAGEVVLSGVVPTYFMKQLAQAIVLRIGQVKAMKNHLEVQYAIGESVAS